MKQKIPYTTTTAIADRICQSLGIGESEVLRQAFMEYAKSISLIIERVHSKI
ncbi:MAG: hypothetical protein QMD23_06490 [Candidatus Bathyarchaeia archaeon]|nr:hypothetical protein [Candidatus Bathyarchaeia archaeon]